MRNVVWESTEEEKQKIKDIYEKKSALENLFKIINKENEIYDTVLEDYIKTSKEFSAWWDEMIKKYNCNIKLVNNLVIDFDTNEIWFDEKERSDDNV